MTTEELHVKVVVMNQSLRTEIVAIAAEGMAHHAVRLDDHENRIKRLEDLRRP